MTAEVRREIATFGGLNVLSFLAPVMLSSNRICVITASDYKSTLPPAALPDKLKGFISGLYHYDVLWEVRVVNDQIHLCLPFSRQGNKITKVETLSLFCQAVTHLTGQQIPEDWDINQVIAYQRGTGFALGETGVALARIMDGMCR